MKNSKKIYIEGKSYILPEHPVAQAGATGTVYRLPIDQEDSAVKIYHSEPILGDDDICYPSLDELEYFIDFSKETLPILLSKHIVYDEDKQYCGCATDFITETRGNTADALFSLPKEFVFDKLHQLWSVIPILDEWGIESNDWSLENIKLGKGRELSEMIYLYDDSNYHVSRSKTNNLWEANYLIEDIVAYYCSTHFQEEIAERICDSITQRDNTLTYLERQSKNFSTLAEALDHKAKVLQKKYF